MILKKNGSCFFFSGKTSEKNMSLQRRPVALHSLHEVSVAPKETMRWCNKPLPRRNIQVPAEIVFFFAVKQGLVDDVVFFFLPLVFFAVFFWNGDSLANFQGTLFFLVKFWKRPLDSPIYRSEIAIPTKNGSCHSWSKQDAKRCKLMLDHAFKFCFSGFNYFTIYALNVCLLMANLGFRFLKCLFLQGIFFLNTAVDGQNPAGFFAIPTVSWEFVNQQ